MLKSPSHEFAEVQLALEKGYRLTPFRGLLFLFWGLILAKCSLVQWSIITYQVPIDGLLYIWTPSIIFGIVCTVVYARLTLEEFHRAPLTNNLVRGIWVACAISLALLGIVGVGFQEFSPWLLPAMLAVMLGLGYCIHGFLDKRPLFFFAAAGWWLGSVWLFYLANTDTLLWLAGMLVAFQVAPSTLLWLERRRQVRGITQAAAG